nr:oligosaccharide flippase family protein [Desulfopila sp. IMCC35008]
MLLGLVTFPILTRLLSVEQYGLLGLITNTLAITVVLAKFGLSDGIIRFHEEYMKNNHEKLIFSSTIFIAGLFFTICTTLFYFVSLPWLYRIIHIKKQYHLCFLVMSVYLSIRPLTIICLNLLRVRGKTIMYNIVNLTNRVLSIVIGLSLFTLVFKELYGYLAGTVISEFIIFTVLVFWFFNNYRVSLGQVSLELIRKLILFGLPLLFTELAYMLLTYTDRYMILYYHGEQELGIYSVGYNLAMYVANMLTFSVSYAIVPLYVKIYTEQGRRETEKFLEDSFYYLMVLIIPVCFGYAAVNKDLFIILATNKYVEAATFSPIIVVATVVFGMNTMLNAGLYLHKKSLKILLIITIGMVLNVLCNIVLLPKFNVMGAAISTLISCVATSILTVIWSFRYLVIRLKVGVIYHLFFSTIMYFTVSYINLENIYISLMVKILYGCVLISSTILYRENEIRAKIMKIFVH